MVILVLLIAISSIFSDEVKETKVDFYKGAKEFVGDIDSIILNQQQLQKMKSDEDFEGRVEDIEKQEESNREISIKSFEEYVRKYPNSPYVPDALYRLSKLYYEDAVQKVIKETENYEKEYQKFTRGETLVLPPDPIVDYNKAIKTLSRLTSEYKNYKYRGEALYLLGYAYFEQGNLTKGIQTYTALIKQYPTSEKLPEVYTRLGEYYFDTDDLSKAVYYYSQVLEYPDSAYYENVLYKLAWTYYHKKKIDDSSNFFVTLIDYNQKKFGAQHTSSTVTEAKNYIAIEYADSPDGISGAYDFFRKIGGRNYEYEIMQKIFELYTSSDRLKESKESFDLIIKNYPYNPENPILHDKLITLTKDNHDLKLMYKERDRMIQLFGEKTEWRERNKDNSKAIMVADQLIKKQLIEAALYHQELGDETKNRKEYIKAAQMYYDFLKKNTMDTMVIGARYNYAKVLYNLGDYRGAIREYAAVRDYTEDDKYREDSSFGVINSWHSKLKNENPFKYKTKELKPLIDENGKLITSHKLSQDEEAFVDACGRYESLNPKGKRLSQVLYVKAEVYFKNNKFENARTEYKKIIGKYPNEKTTYDSIRNIVASYTYEKDYPKIEIWSKKLLAYKNFDTQISDVEGIRNLMVGSVFKSARQMEDDGRLEEAADEYIRLVKQYPNSKYSDAALYNAGIIYEKIGNPTNAIKAYNLILKRYPKSKHSIGSMFRIAVNNEQQLDFNQALHYYDTIIKKYPKTTFAVDSNYNASRLRRAFNQYGGAADHLMAYYDKTSDPKDKANAIMQAADLYEKSGDTKKALNAHSIYIKNSKEDLEGLMRAHINKAKIYQKENKKLQAHEEYKKAVSIFASSKNKYNTITMNRYNAQARFGLLNDLGDKYYSIKVKEQFSSKAIKDAYNKKQQMLQMLSEEYLKIINLGFPEWSVASLYMIGGVFYGFAEFLYKAPVPKELNTEQLKNEYTSQIQAQAMPYEDKAIDYYEKCISESVRLKVANEWTKKSRKKLTQLKPDQHKEVEEEIIIMSPSMEIRDYGFVGK